MSKWDIAIEDAKSELAEVEQRRRQLQRAVRIFEWCKREGLPWPEATRHEGDQQLGEGMVETIDARVRRVINESGIPAAIIEPGSDFREDLGCDSLDMMDLRLAFEEAFGIDIPDYAADRLLTVQSVIDYVTARLGAQPPAHHPV